MRKITLALLAFQFIGLISCKDELATEPVSIYKGSIVNFLTEIRDKNDAYISGIQEVENGIDFKTIKIYDLITTEKLLIGDLGPLNKFPNADRSKVLFFLNNNEIVRSLIVTFEGAGKNGEYDLAVVSILNMRGSLPNYSGKISFYSIFQKLILFNVYKDGKLNTNGIVRKFQPEKNNGRTNACTDWYLVTTYHYVGGSTRTEEFYLGTTCDEPCGFAGARVNCGGGGGGGGGGTVIPTTQFPQNPNNGDVYETTDRDGVYTKYQWDSYKQLWIGIMRILPVFVLQDNPSLYPFLRVRNPVDGRVILSPDDNMAYTYNAGSGSWVGELIYAVPGIRGNLIKDLKLFLNCIDTNNPATITIYIDQPVLGERAVRSGDNVGHTFIGITQKQANGSITVSRIFGFYPKSEFVTPFNPSGPSSLGNDQGHTYDISIPIQVSPEKLSSIINYIINDTPTEYHLSNFNCTSYGIGIASICGVSLPNTISCWTAGINGCGNNPGDLGEDLKNNPNSVSSPNSTAPANSGCLDQIN
jgi:hypothetical protein